MIGTYNGSQQLKVFLYGFSVMQQKPLLKKRKKENLEYKKNKFIEGLNKKKKKKRMIIKSHDDGLERKWSKKDY